MVFFVFCRSTEGYFNCPLQDISGVLRVLFAGQQWAGQQWGTLIILCKTLGGTLITSCRTIVGHFEYPLQSSSGVHWAPFEEQQWGTMSTLCRTVGYFHCPLQGHQWGNFITPCKTSLRYFACPLHVNSDALQLQSAGYRGEFGLPFSDIFMVLVLPFAVNVLVGVGSILTVDACRGHAWLVPLVGY